jgi:hypothetical protein
MQIKKKNSMHGCCLRRPWLVLLAKGCFLVILLGLMVHNVLAILKLRQVLPSKDEVTETDPKSTTAATATMTTMKAEFAVTSFKANKAVQGLRSQEPTTSTSTGIVKNVPVVVVKEALLEFKKVYSASSTPLIRGSSAGDNNHKIVLPVGQVQQQVSQETIPPSPHPPPPVDPFYEAGQPPKALQCSDLHRMPSINSKRVTNTCVDNHSFTQMVHTLGDIVSASIASYGCWEPHIVTSIVQHFGTTPSQSQRRTLIDVGGNIGGFTTTMAYLGHRVITVEPFRLNVPLILQTLCDKSNNNNNNINNMMDNVHLFKVALSDKSPGQKMCLWSTHSEINNGNARLVPYFEGRQDFGQDKGKECMEIIHSYTLDELLFGQSATADGTHHHQQQQPLVTSRPWGMKMDIEGYETLALRGAQQLLRLFPPCRIWFEYQREVTLESGAGATEIFDMLRSEGNYTKLYQIPTGTSSQSWKLMTQPATSNGGGGIDYGEEGDFMAVHNDPECQVDLPSMMIEEKPVEKEKIISTASLAR